MVAVDQAGAFPARDAAASSGRALGYMPQIDTLRAIAVASVMFEHYLPYQFHKLGMIDGVLLFFAISGFLITGILLNYRDAMAKGAARLGQALGVFYARRTLRIFPAYYLLIFLLFVTGFAGASDVFTWHLTYTTNIWTAIHQRWDTVAGHFWSLSVEEQFYLCWPLIALTAPRRALAWIMGAGVLVGIAFRAAAVQFHWGLAIITLPMANFDALLGGGLLAWAQWSNKAGALVVLRRFGIVSLPLVAASYLAPHDVRDVLMPTAMALASVYVIDQCSIGYRGWLGWLFSRPLVLYFGKISYGLYLYHYVVRLWTPDGWFAGLSGGVHDYVRALAWMGAAIVCAMLSWHAFEQPLNGLKNRFRLAKA